MDNLDGTNAVIGKVIDCIEELLKYVRHLRNNGSITSLLTNDFVTFSDPTSML
jgi:hypothetical protein